MDRPLKYGLQRAPIPYYGGVAIFTAFVLSSIIFVPISKEFLGLILGAVLIVGVGFFDDLLDLSPMIRMLVQVLAAIVLVGFGVGILSVNLPFIGVLDFTGWELNGVFVWSALFTVFWVVIILNTMNFIDGVSGLSSGVTFIAGLTLFVLSIHPGVHENPQSQEGVAIIAIVLAMVAFAFLLFDFPRPRILMGDSGSTFFGFMIAALAIFSGGKVATAFLVLGIPILDMVWVVLRRLFSGQKIWKGDLKHLHHRLLNLGFSKRQVVLMYLLVTALLGVLAVSLVSLQQKLFILIALILMMVLLASALVFIPKRR
jgi:UDP-GlcNAc:undecaprenyl-phosphate GlcNAc-1-phosphate transferase